jgi:hypothetical protein
MADEVVIAGLKEQRDYMVFPGRCVAIATTRSGTD